MYYKTTYRIAGDSIMIGIGTLLNVAGIILGGFIGLICGKLITSPHAGVTDWLNLKAAQIGLKV